MHRNIHRIEPVSFVVAVLAGCTFLLLSARALFAPDIPFDSWAYHLPFASRLFSIGGGQATFELIPELQARYAGFPLAGEFMQGLFWRVSGKLNGVMLPNILMLLALLGSAQLCLGLRWYVMLMALSCCPAFVLHYVCTYLDFMAGASLATGCMFLAAYANEVYTERNGRSRRYLIAGLSFLTLAANTKFQGWFCACVSWGFLFVGLIILKREDPTQRRRDYYYLAGALLLMCAVPIRNTLVHENPFFPIQLKLGGIVLSGPERDFFSSPEYLAGTAFRPVGHLLSATEGDWWIRGVIKGYEIDGHNGDIPQYYKGLRTGGWGEGFVAVNGLLLLFQCFTFRQLRAGEQFRIALLVLLGLAVACLPQSHILRYWLVLPFLAAAFNLSYLSERLPRAALIASIGSAGVIMLATAFLAFRARGELWPQKDYLRTAPEVFRSPGPEYRTFVLQTLPTDLLPFRFSEAATGYKNRFVNESSANSPSGQ